MPADVAFFVTLMPIAKYLSLFKTCRRSRLHGAYMMDGSQIIVSIDHQAQLLLSIVRPHYMLEI
jgi:hypothetical protein